MKGAVHMCLTVVILATCFTVGWFLNNSSWPFGLLNGILLITSMMIVGLLFSWRGVANFRASEDLYLLAQVRKMGGRITAKELAAKAHRNIMRVTRFLECKVQRGQAVMFKDEGEVTYIFDGFVDQTDKDLAFRL